MDDTPLTDEELWEMWEAGDPDDDLPGPPRGRRPALIAVAALTAIALAVVPLYNLFRAPRVSDSGLEVCGFDYCVVQEAMRDAGLLPVMNRLSGQFLDDAGAQALADDIAVFLGVDPVPLTVVDRLEGRLGGVYDPTTRTILIRETAQVWTVAHEMAHVVSSGHGEDFIETLAAIARWLDA